MSTYSKPELEIIMFEAEDIIVTSNDTSKPIELPFIPIEEIFKK